ncbi:hypothetical protein OUZ56_006063 [Daphnia magna]|uniref:Uncharacterized protein n=1 Tax=Daphnia magna TaxID=35525 RepID=A0ABQ9YUK7_9CRUS|nr:hypothetical protein OUZ56_006063 [Daphnia magna]
MRLIKEGGRQKLESSHAQNALSTCNSWSVNNDLCRYASHLRREIKDSFKKLVLMTRKRQDSSCPNSDVMKINTC